MSLRHRALLTAVALAILATPAYAQQSSSVTQADVQRLQDNVYLADRDISQLRSRDTTRANQLVTELDDLRDEVVYLKVKLRKEQTLSRSEYADVRDRIEDLRSRARGDVASATPAPASSSSATSAATSAPRPAPAPVTTPAPATRSSTTTSAAGALEIPVGTEIDVRLQNSLNSGTAQVEDRFEATTVTDVLVDGRVAIPSGAVARGVVTAVEPGTRTNRTAKMTVSFDQVTVNGRSYPIRGTVTQAIEGKEVELPQGSILRVRLDSPVQVDTQTRR